MRTDIRTQLAADGFVEIGCFNITTTGFTYNLTHPEARAWTHSLYAWVSLKDDGLVLRIGKCEGPLEKRIAAYKRSLQNAMGDRLGPNQFFKGDTQPWEREGWIAHASAPDGGLIYAQQLQSSHNHPTAAALRKRESAFIKSHNPPLCGVSNAGKAAKLAWVTKYGAAVPIKKRPKPTLKQAHTANASTHAEPRIKT